MIWNGANANYIISLHFKGYIGAESSDVEHSYGSSVYPSYLGLPTGDARNIHKYTITDRK